MCVWVCVRGTGTNGDREGGKTPGRSRNPADSHVWGPFCGTIGGRGQTMTVQHAATFQWLVKATCEQLVSLCYSDLHDLLP